MEDPLQVAASLAGLGLSRVPLSSANATPRKPTKHAKSRNKIEFDRALDRMVISEAPLTAEIRRPCPGLYQALRRLVFRTLCPAARQLGVESCSRRRPAPLQLSTSDRGPQGSTQQPSLLAGHRPSWDIRGPRNRSTLQGGHKYTCRHSSCLAGLQEEPGYLHPIVTERTIESARRV